MEKNKVDKSTKCIKSISYRKRTYGHLFLVLSFLIFFIGFNILIAPFVLEQLFYIKVYKQSESVKATWTLSPKNKEAELEKLRAFNEAQRKDPGRFQDDPFQGTSLDGRFIVRENPEPQPDAFQPESMRAADIDDQLRKEIFGFLSIPDLALELPIFLGATKEHLEAGVSQVDGTSLPIGGQNTHCVLASHSYMQDTSLFSRLHELPLGSIVSVENPYGKIYYRMTNKIVIEPTDVDYLNVVRNEDRLSLLTCIYLDGFYKRLVYFGDRIENPNPENDTNKSLVDDLLKAEKNTQSKQEKEKKDKTDLVVSSNGEEFSKSTAKLARENARYNLFLIGLFELLILVLVAILIFGLFDPKKSR